MSAYGNTQEQLLPLKPDLNLTLRYKGGGNDRKKYPLIFKNRRTTPPTVFKLKGSKPQGTFHSNRSHQISPRNEKQGNTNFMRLLPIDLLTPGIFSNSAMRRGSFRAATLPVTPTRTQNFFCGTDELFSAGNPGSGSVKGSMLRSNSTSTEKQKTLD